MSMYLGAMDHLQGTIVGSVAAVTAGALISGLWQGALLVAATGVLLKVVPRSTATLRFAIWAAVFCVAAGMPLVLLVSASRGNGMGAPISATHLEIDLRWSYALAGLWLAATLVRLGHLALQGLGLWSLWKSAVPVAADDVAGLDLRELLQERGVRLCTSNEVDRPSVIGFVAPRILIPTWLFEQLSADELHHIALHEMEHLRRRDDWVNLIQKLGLVLFPLNPALFWVDRRLSAERELACDDGVLERTKTPRAYATCLTTIAERRLDHRLHRRIAELALGAIGSFHRRPEFSRRIESILNRRPALSPAGATVFAAVLVGGIVGGAVALARSPQLVSFGLPGGQAAAVATREGVISTGAPYAAPMPPKRAAGYQEVSFHPAIRASHASSVAAGSAAKTHAQAATSHPATKHAATPGPQQGIPQQWVVLTSWEQVPATRVVVRLPDGQVFSVPYAAVPTRDGWLIVQL